MKKSLQEIEKLKVEFSKKFDDAYKLDLEKTDVFDFIYLDTLYFKIRDEYIEGMINYKTTGIKYFQPLFASYYSHLPQDIQKILDE